MNTPHIDIGLARYSDWAFTSSIVVLVIALLLLAVELAYSGSRKADARELVTARRGHGVAADSAQPGRRRRRPEAAGRRADRPGRPGAGVRRHRDAVRLHRAARTGDLARAVGQHVRVHQPDLLLRAGRRGDRAAPAEVPRAVGVRAAAGADPAGGLGQVAVLQRRARDARAAVLLVADPRVGGQPRLGGVPRRRRREHAVPGQDVTAGRRRPRRAGSRPSSRGCPTRRPWTGSPTARPSSRSRSSASA